MTVEHLWAFVLKGQTERKDIAFNIHLSPDILGVLAEIQDGAKTV